MQLAGAVHDPAFQTHFVRMAREWSSLAGRGPKAGSETRDRSNGSHSTRGFNEVSQRTVVPPCFYIVRRPFVSP
jgi:hypothetical protein